MHRDRYILDPLYGRLTFPGYVWAIAGTPEVQRLREVRMCNINSLSLLGAASVNRYEHSLGTAHLAAECIDSWPSRVSADTRRQFQLAALLHDVGTAGFGHSVEYVLDGRGFRHDDFAEVVSGAPPNSPSVFAYRHSSLEALYFGAVAEVVSLLSTDDLRIVTNLVDGAGRFGQLINGTVDLDNIDNVYRLSYHMGLTQQSDVPLRLARGLYTDSAGQLRVDDQEVGLLGDWQLTRAALYDLLLLNPDEFSAKCMLERALVMAAEHCSDAYRWQYVDYQLMERLSGVAPETHDIVQRLMLGQLYGCVGIFETSNLDFATVLASPSLRAGVEESLTDRVRSVAPGSKLSIALHGIADVNKTWRSLRLTASSGRPVVFERRRDRLLVGVFLTNMGFDVNALDTEWLDRHGVVSTVSKFLGEACGVVSGLEIYGEGAVGNRRVLT